MKTATVLLRLPSASVEFNGTECLLLALVRPADISVPLDVILLL